MITRRELSIGLLAGGAWARPSTNRWPGAHWEPRPPAALGLDAAKLEELAAALGGNGCVIKDGFLAHSWGDQSAKRDWLSSVKPVFSTLLFFAIQEKRLKSVDVRLTGYGWALRDKHRTMTFRHLAAMTSGYARPEPPGAAYAYNDYAIQLYQLTLFDRLYREAPDAVANAPPGSAPCSWKMGSPSTPGAVCSPPCATSPASAGSGSTREIGTAGRCSTAPSSVNT